MRILNTHFTRFTTLGLFITTLLALSFTSCSEDDTIAFIPQLPANGGDNVKKIVHSGKMMKNYDWTFTYNGPRIVNAAGISRDPQEDKDRQHVYTSSLKYGENYVGVYNSNGEPVSLTLNNQGYISNMEVGRNKNAYTFLYDDGRMVAWHKTIYEDNFGHTNTYETSAVINYDNGNLESIIMIGPDKVPVTTKFVSSAMENRNGLLPETATEQMGCLGFEHLYYAGLLGKSTKNMVKSLTVSYANDPKKGYTLNFEYGTEKNNVTLCNYHTDTDEIASVRYDY